MNKLYFSVLVLLVGLSGCIHKKAKKEGPVQGKGDQIAFAEVDIPVADEAVTSFFDEEVGEFAFAEEPERFEDDFVDEFDLSQDMLAEADYQDAYEVASAELDQPVEEAMIDDFAWVDEQSFKNVYFDFDKSNVRTDQEAVLAHNIECAKELIAQNPDAKIVIGGHCDKVGNKSYNLALSEKRAKIQKDRLVEAGVPAQNIKIVGFGQDMPAEVDGHLAMDDSDQWLNRRDEISVVVS